MGKLPTVFAALVLALAALACGGPQTVEVEVTRIVPKTVEVTRVVPQTVEVTRVVQVVITATPKPEPPTPTATDQEPIEFGEPVVVARKAYDRTTRLDIFTLFKNPNPDWWLPSSQVTLSIFDTAGNIIGTDDTYIVVPPGKDQAVLFTGVNIGDQTYDRVQIELSRETMRPLSRWPGADVELVQANLVGDSIVGQVKNVGQVEIPQTQVMAVVRDANGNVIALDFTYADKMQPGQTVPFQLSLLGLEEGSVDRFDLYLEPELVAGTF